MSENLIWAHTETPEDGDFMTFAELRNQVDRAEVRFFENLEYWTYQADEGILRHNDPIYEVYLEHIPNTEAYLEWILRIHAKQWMSKEAFVEFVTATRYLLSDKLYI